MKKQEPLPSGQNKKNEKKTLEWLAKQPLDRKLELINHHLKLSQVMINECLEQEVEDKAGPRYSHGHRYDRWSSNPGSARVGDRKVRFDVPRLYDKQEKRYVSPDSYHRIKDRDEPTDQLLKGILKGLSMRDYGSVVDQLGESFGLSKSTLSDRFRRRAAQALKAFENRDLSDRDIVAIYMDGKYLADQQIIIALGVDRSGEKIPLGFVQAPSEHHRPIKELLNDLKQRGLDWEEGLLFIVDGSKGLHKAIKERLGACGLIQRCWWHKRQNILSYIPEKAEKNIRAGFHQALAQTDYEDARAELIALEEEIRPINRTAANSLKEGREELLTLHRLGLNTIFAKSFTTTNCIENINSQLEKYIGKVKRWQTSEQRYQWIGAGLMEIEDNLRKVDYYKELDKMKQAIKNEVKKQKQNKSSP